MVDDDNETNLRLTLRDPLKTPLPKFKPPDVLAVKAYSDLAQMTRLPSNSGKRAGWYRRDLLGLHNAMPDIKDVFALDQASPVKQQRENASPTKSP